MENLITNCYYSIYNWTLLIIFLIIGIPIKKELWKQQTVGFCPGVVDLSHGKGEAGDIVT